MESWAGKSGYECERILGVAFDLNNTNSALVFKKRWMKGFLSQKDRNELMIPHLHESL
jgi:hypothetical protein